ncbi:hypothetical protein SAMN02745225_00573 [Ferrithrix thermotolerans DSM 19514]|uniref:Uncharacterized protein n=1 Tax=Ferrithrix thermotolerans DSM 19514 TaxID=1121881 RepID=A0A1M4TDW1_9ACTN|nr:hypothetical protein SAMN02745225_00573 [Ferrithrix thermotolerans DSM 19514]
MQSRSQRRSYLLVSCLSNDTVGMKTIALYLGSDVLSILSYVKVKLR